MVREPCVIDVFWNQIGIPALCRVSESAGTAVIAEPGKIVLLCVSPLAPEINSTGDEENAKAVNSVP